MKMKNTFVSYYPVFLDLNGRRCVVVGGGSVALRKVKALLDSGALVEVISPRLCSGLKQLYNDKKINVTSRKFQPGDLAGAFIAIAATASPQTNAAVAAEGLERSVMVNVVDDPARCDFILPSYCRRGGLILSVSTSGMSPALARKIMSRLEKEFGPEYGTLATITQKVRKRLKKEKIKVGSSRWQQALDLDRLTGLIRSGHTDEAEDLLLNTLREEQI